MIGSQPGPVTLHDVIAIRGTYVASLSARPRTSLVAFEPPLSVVCHPVEGAQVVAAAIAGYVTRASRETLEVHRGCPVELRSTLLVVFGEAGRDEGGEAYGQVAGVESAADGSVVIVLALTAVPPDVERVLEERIAAHA